MTFCFAFKASPDGIAIITDTRLSTLNQHNELETLSGNYLKVVSPRENCVIAFSGIIGQIKELIVGLEECLTQINENIQYEEFLRLTKNRYSEMWQRGVFANAAPEIAIIYSDTRHSHGSTRCRLSRLVFGVKNSKPYVSEETGVELEYVSIGWIPEGRKLLSSRAADALSELESRNLIIDTNCDKLAASLPISSTVKHSVRLDSSGERNFTFRKKLRAYCNSLDKTNQANIAFEPMLIFGAAALRAIESQMHELRKHNIPDHNCIGDNWTLVTLTRRYGLRIHPDSELRACW